MSKMLMQEVRPAITGPVTGTASAVLTVTGGWQNLPDVPCTAGVTIRPQNPDANAEGTGPNAAGVMVGLVTGDKRWPLAPADFNGLFVPAKNCNEIWVKGTNGDKIVYGPLYIQTA